MAKRKKKIVCIVAWILTVTLAFCIVFAAFVVLPQICIRNKRYEQTKRFGNGDVGLIAHRGLSGLALENTIPAFEEAGKRSFYGVEADVQVTKDGKFIIVHDDDLSRIVGIDNKISESTFDELRALRFQDVYGENDGTTYFLPSLEEFILVCKQYDKQAILELKGEMTFTAVAEIGEEVQALGWFERTTFISFSSEKLLALREAYPQANAQYIVKNVDQKDIDFMIEHHLDANIFWAAVTPSRVRRLHKAGLKVNCWTVDGRACAWYMKFCGVDFITTNILE